MLSRESCLNSMRRLCEAEFVVELEKSNLSLRDKSKTRDKLFSLEQEFLRKATLKTVKSSMILRANNLPSKQSRRILRRRVKNVLSRLINSCKCYCVRRSGHLIKTTQWRKFPTRVHRYFGSAFLRHSWITEYRRRCLLKVRVCRGSMVLQIKL